MKKMRTLKTKDIHQEVVFKAAPHDVYEALMDPKKHAEFTHSTVTIERKIGGKVTAYDDYIDGENVELVPGEKIVQRWHASDWPKGHYSLATFVLKPHKRGTQLIFNQTGVPAEQYQDIFDGWHDHYWEPMRAILE